MTKSKVNVSALHITTRTVFGGVEGGGGGVPKYGCISFFRGRGEY